MTGAYDAILIGAGHNTLAAALHLSAKGWRVGVFEQAPVAGGAVKTGAYTLPGFRHSGLDRPTWSPWLPGEILPGAGNGDSV